MAGRKPVSRKKAKKIMRHGAVRGKKLTPKQKGLFGMIAGGETPKTAEIKTPAKGRRKKKTRRRSY